MSDAVSAGKLARRAMAFNKDSAMARAARGFVEFDLDNENFAAAADLKKAVEIEPDLAVAHLWYGSVLLWLGDPRPARTELESASSLDSSLPDLDYLLALDFYMSRDYKNAIAFGKLAIGDEWSSTASHLLLAAAHEESGQYESAIADVRLLTSSSSELLAASCTRAHVYASMGERGRSAQELKVVERLSAQYRYRPVLTAVAYVANDQPDQAFAWLSRLPQSDRRLFGLDPRLDFLRRDHRFVQWLHG